MSGEEAFEFYTHQKGTALLDEIERDEHCAVIYQPVPDGANERAATLVCPFEIANNWSCLPYQEDKIIPAYLQQAEMASKSSVLIGHLADQSMPSPNVDKKTTLTQRNFILGSEISDDIKSKILADLVKFGSEERKRRENSEKTEQVKQNDALNGDRVELLNRFLDLAKEEDFEGLRLKWEEATAPPPPPPVELAKPKLSAEDWERINQGHQQTRENLQALRQHKVPNYWESAAGQKFLASGENCATKAMKDLPPQVEIFI